MRLWQKNREQFTKILRITALAALLGTLTFGGAAMADDANIETRQSLMRTVKAAIKVSAAMAKGGMDYDPVKAVLAMNIFYAASTGFSNYFGEDDWEDLDTEAGPKIWSDRDGFMKIHTMFRADSAAAIKTVGDGPDAFTAAFGKVAGNRKSCHEIYRVKKSSAVREQIPAVPTRHSHGIARFKDHGRRFSPAIIFFNSVQSDGISYFLSCAYSDIR